MKYIALCSPRLKAAIALGGKSILSLFVLFVDVLHEDLVFRSSQRTVEPAGADVAWDGCSVSPPPPCSLNAVW